MSEEDQVRPPKGLLSGAELIQESKQIENFKMEHRGLKKTLKRDTQEEKDEVEEYRDEFRTLLGLERVAPTSSHSLGVFESDANRVLVTKHEGKWRYGYVENSQQYLLPHESLYLIEMNRLRVEYNNVIVSLEQAYYLFLDPARNGLKYEQYVVYAHFMRTGFLVLKHDQQLDKQTFEANTNQSQNQLDNELIWCNLLKNLNLPFNEELALEHKESFEAMNSSVVQSSNNIKDQKTTGFAYNELNQDIEMENAKPTTRSFYLRVKCPTKRKLNSSEEPPVKVPRLNENHYLDILKVEQIQISNLVSIDIIKKTPLVSGGRELEFDVYLPDTNYKKTLLPDYRMIVVKSTQLLPTNQEIHQLFMKQFCKLPILMVVVSESMSIHPSIYRM